MFGNPALKTVVAAALAFILASSQANGATGQPVTPSALAKIIEKAGILSPGYGVTVTVSGQEATVRTYSNKFTRNLENDCKIDAVLIAKQLFSADPSHLFRAKVIFYEMGQSGKYACVPVTAGDVKAYASRQLTMQQLLSSLEVTHGTDSRANQGSTAGGASPPHSTAQADSIPPRVIYPQPSCPEKLVPFIDRSLGLTFMYPSGSVVRQHPDKDTAAKIACVTPGGQMFQIQLGRTDNPDSASPQSFARAIDYLRLRLQPSYHLIEQGPILFGRDRNIAGFILLVSLKGGGQQTRQAYVYFQDGRMMDNFVFSCPETQFASLKPLFETILSSVILPPAGSTQPLSTTAGKQAPSGAADSESSVWRDDNGIITFSYPRGWQVRVHPEAGTIVKINGVQGAGGAEISLTATGAEPGATVEMFAHNVEATFLVPLKNYTRLSEGKIKFGMNRNLEGLRRIAHFDSDAGPFLIQSVYFERKGNFLSLNFSSTGFSPEQAIARFDRVLASFSLAN